MNRISFITAISLIFSANLLAQYAPPAGQPGTRAMHMDSSAFVNWCSGARIIRGLQDISDPGSGPATAGDSSMATGKALSNPIVSLGDGGQAICTFPRPIRNGNGADFAVFENSFDDTFLELGFIEVSSDGSTFFRFKSHSLTDTTIQTSGFGATTATKINNLAGKYRGGYGTPFDLEELKNTPGLDINAVTHVKIIDVIGSINKYYATRDGSGNKINDPWPTPFPSSGFDLDAVGVINENTATGIRNTQIFEPSFYPNPVGTGEKIVFPPSTKGFRVLDLAGREVLRSMNYELHLQLNPGVYFVEIRDSFNLRMEKIVVY